MSQPKSNPKTEVAEIVPDGDSFKVEDAPDANSPKRVLRGIGGVELRALTFRDEQDEDGYHNETPVTGGVVASREMSDEDFNKFVAKILASNSAIKAPADAEKNAQSLESKGEHGKAAEIRMDAQTKFRQGQVDMLVSTKEMMDRYAVGWDFARPFAKGDWKKLRADDQSALMLDIIQKSLTGRQDNDFLADVSFAL